MKKINRGGWAAIGMFVLVVVAMTAAGRDARTQSKPAPATPGAALIWYPSGFVLTAQDPTVAYRWLEKAELDCTYSSGSCWGMFAIPRDGCGTLYVELSIEDASGTVIGMTNDVVSGVAAGQRAKLVFDTFDKAAATARVADVSCY